MQQNIWFPYEDTLKKVHNPNSGGVLVIIPTALRNINRLYNCIDSLQKAGKGISYKIILVVCPVDQITINRLGKLKYNNIQIILINKRFNYCHSINVGINEIDDSISCVLFLNDDVQFTKNGDLNILTTSLFQEGWACIGPRIKYNPNFNNNRWPKKKSSLIDDQREKELQR